MPRPWSPSPAMASSRPSASSWSRSRASIAVRPGEHPGPASRPSSWWRGRQHAVWVPAASGVGSRASGSVRRNAGASAGARQRRSSSSSSQATVTTAGQSRLVTSSPTSGATTSSPARSRRAWTEFHNTNSSSYFTDPRPLTTTVTRLPASGGCCRGPSRPSPWRAVGGGQRSLADPGFTVDAEPPSHGLLRQGEQGCVGAGKVQPSNATPKERVRSLAPGHRGDASEVVAGFGGGAGDLEHDRSPATPRRRCSSPTGADATSSVTACTATSWPWARSRAAAAEKLRTSPA